MSKGGNKTKSLANPIGLRAIDLDDDSLVQVIIETPKGSRNKFSFDEKQRVFELKKVLPAGMAFPYDFGFVPRTLAEDGDPVDVLVLMDQPAFAGCAVKCRLIGIIEGKQIAGKKSLRNDRVVAVAKPNHSWADIQQIDDLGKTFLRELEDFFVNYHELSDTQYELIGVKGPKHARKRIDQGMRAAKRS